MIDIKNLKPINNSPINVDYNNMDEEGGIRLNTKGAINSIKELNLELKEGQLVWISDSELEYLGVIIYRRDIWIAVPISSSRNNINGQK